MTLVTKMSRNARLSATARQMMVFYRRPLSTPAAPQKSMLDTWYSTFGKSSVAYATWLVFGILGAELVTGWATDAVWNSVNYGRTFDTIDWTQFKSEDDDEDDEEEDEDDEDEDEEGEEDEDDDDDE
mmetsp:Transcript_27231/g.41804  ORF Transcript_27231/g.41804 Transcript_27231/m.41804 type:complete len:127 (+) Transcript_27231:79-459(+)|eukprot:CAMPEP_0118706828 /NCGR_PEP_ID=MMETSP0800-20121206/20809_1 /TAXON_ID=210618 ORGANISM="Striatella unipunctata, Strain CCMP2910" /NCGR_SAMPLE_ID=MMETSP0800 /ASSEMBLY_ACC=CAM_ASM_000638 /LENGTH=126 /DNA_ID=CAMNT_0006609475 /DNA_START=37 /DNA_END=417 /DNA_ORIENTATION=+